MAKLFDGQGNAVEAFTQEEVTKMVAEDPSIKAANDAKAKAEADLAEANKKIAEFDGSDKSKNMAALREAKETLEKAVEEKTKGLVTAVEELKKGQASAELDKSFIAIAQGDEDLAQKIKAEYNAIVKPEDTEEVKREKMGKAYRLASGYTPSPSVLSRVLGSSGAPANNGNQKGYKPELVEFGKKFGLTADDFEKYGRK